MTYEKRLKELGLFSLKKKKARKRHDNSLQICKIVRGKKNYFLHIHWIEIETTVAKYVFFWSLIEELNIWKITTRGYGIILAF